MLGGGRGGRERGVRFPRTLMYVSVHVIPANIKSSTEADHCLNLLQKNCKVKTIGCARFKEETCTHKYSIITPIQSHGLKYLHFKSFSCKLTNIDKRF